MLAAWPLAPGAWAGTKEAAGAATAELPLACSPDTYLSPGCESCRDPASKQSALLSFLRAFDAFGPWTLRPHCLIANISPKHSSVPLGLYKYSLSARQH